MASPGDPDRPGVPDEDERFENATPVTIEDAAEAAVDRVEPGSVALPPLDVAVQRVPAATRVLLDELFKAKFTAVRRVSPEELR